MELTAAGTVQDFHLIPFWLVPDMGLAHHCGAKINKNRFEVQGVYKKLIKGEEELDGQLLREVIQKVSRIFCMVCF